jgi:hypothetical protein
MPLLPKSVLKTYFERGDQPNESQFFSLIDSSLNLLDDQKYLGLKNYNTTVGYTAGDVVVYSGTFYQANATTSGTFDPSKWVAFNFGGGGGGIISILYSDLQMLKAASNLVPGQVYYITDKSIWIHALAIGELSLSGHYMAMNADYQNTGGFNVGVWHMGLTGLVAGQSVAIWNNLNWLSITGTVSGQPEYNPGDWSLLTPPSDPNYTMEIDPVKYDFDLDFIFERSDKRGNFVSSIQDPDGILGRVPLEVFQWGRDGVSGNVVKNSVLNSINCVTVNSSITATDFSYITLTENVNASYGIFSGANAYQGGTSNISKTIIRNMAIRPSMTVNPGKRVEPGFSNFQEAIEIFGTVLGLIGYNYAGDFLLKSSNATEMLNYCDLPPTEHPFILRPDAGLVVEIQSSTAHMGEFVMNVTSLVLDGDRGDFAEFKTDSGGRIRLLRAVNYIF